MMQIALSLLASTAGRWLVLFGLAVFSAGGAWLHGYTTARDACLVADKTAELKRELANAQASLELMRRAASDASARAADLAIKATQAEGALDDYRKEVAARPPETKCDLTDADIAALKRLRSQGSTRPKPAAPR